MLNHVTPTDDEPEIDFGQAKAKLLTSIYNWRISYPDDVIFISLADITACFRQQHISCDITGAFDLWQTIYISCQQATSLDLIPQQVHGN